MLGCQSRHEFSGSNSWTTSTDVPPKELGWPPCTNWRLGWCKMPRVPVLAQRSGCCQVVVNWYWMLCHTQYIHNLAWNEQWSGTASAVCLCPLPTSSVQPLGWDWASLHWFFSALMCSLKERCESNHSPRNFVDSSTGRSVSLILIVGGLWAYSVLCTCCEHHGYHEPHHWKAFNLASLFFAQFLWTLLSWSETFCGVWHDTLIFAAIDAACFDLYH